jgi:hypothetical protein
MSPLVTIRRPKRMGWRNPEMTTIGRLEHGMINSCNGSVGLIHKYIYCTDTGG